MIVVPSKKHQATLCTVDDNDTATLMMGTNLEDLVCRTILARACRMSTVGALRVAYSVEPIPAPAGDMPLQSNQRPAQRTPEHYKDDKEVT